MVPTSPFGKSHSVSFSPPENPSFQSDLPILLSNSTISFLARINFKNSDAEIGSNPFIFTVFVYRRCHKINQYSRQEFQPDIETHKTPSRERSSGGKAKRSLP